MHLPDLREDAMTLVVVLRGRVVRVAPQDERRLGRRHRGQRSEAAMVVLGEWATKVLESALNTRD